MTAPGNRRTSLLIGGGALLLAAAGVATTLAFRNPERTPDEEVPNWVEPKRVRSGDTLVVDNDNKLVYAGIRAPIEGEPLYEESKARNAQLIEGKRLRVRYEQDERDKKDRLLGYAWVDKQFVNALLVRDGLAYVRLTPMTQRFAKELLAAQGEARRAQRGLWKLPPRAPESEYWADPKYGNFHRPSCEERQKAKVERVVAIKTASGAFDSGLAPCPKCKP